MEKNKEGWWTYDDLSLQADDVLDLYDWLAEYTNRPQQQVGEYDWSSGHSKAQDGGLNAHAFNKGTGGKQTLIRPTLLDHDECVGHEDAEASVYRSHDGAEWSALPMAGYTEVDCRVRKGDTHHSVFRECDPPPFKELKRPKHGVFEEVTIKRRRPKGGEPYDEPIVKKHMGYVGECKGSDQYLSTCGSGGYTSKTGKPLMARWLPWY